MKTTIKKMDLILICDGDDFLKSKFQRPDEYFLPVIVCF